MKKTIAIATALLTVCASGFAALPPGTSTSQRVHVSNSHPMHTPTGNRVRMTPTHGQMGPAGGRMSSMPNVHRHDGSTTATVRVGPPPGPPAGPRYDRVYVRSSLPVYYYGPPVPPRWRYGGYYSGHYWRPYYNTLLIGYPYPYYGGYYAPGGIVVRVRM